MDEKKKNIATCLTFAALLGAGFFACLWMPKGEYSYSERRRLADLPQLSAHALWEGRFMSGFEGYAADHFPFRDSFRTLQALTACHVFSRQDNHGIYAAEGFLAAIEYPLHEDSLDYAVSRFRYICQKYLTQENRIFFSVVPDKGCFLAQSCGRPSLDYAAFEQMAAEKASFAVHIPLLDLLGPYDYYKTDPHWRQERITDVAERLAQAMGAKLSGEYCLHTFPSPFYGAYYGQAALPFAPDKLYYLTEKSMGACHVYDWQNEQETTVYNLEKALEKDPYDIFLSGALPLLTIKNPQAPQDKKLVIFRDSFASALAPLLISGYSEITLADIRYIHPAHLPPSLDFSGRDILFLYSTLTLNHSDTIK